jgi:hypothetical protein
MAAMTTARSFSAAPQRLVKAIAWLPLVILLKEMKKHMFSGVAL